MQIKYTNFDGDWDAACPFCGKPQRDHQVNNGELDGVRYIHRLPCVAEKKHMVRQRVMQANVVRVVVSIYEIGVYIWSRVPFKKEAALIFRVVKCAYVGLRGYLYYRRKYGKEE